MQMLRHQNEWQRARKGLHETLLDMTEQKTL